MQLILNAAKQEAHDAGKIVLGIATVNALIKALQEEPGQKHKREDGWTIAYCLMEFDWTQDARAAARQTIVNNVGKVLMGDDSGQTDAANPALKMPKSVSGVKLDRHILSIARQYAEGEGGAHPINMEGALSMYQQGMKDKKITISERWTLRYCIAGFLYEPEALAWLLKKLRTIDICQSSLSDSQPRILIISDNLPRHELLIQAAKENVVVCPVKYDTWTLDTLASEIAARAGKADHQYASVAFIDHGGPGQFCLLKSLGEHGLVDLDCVQNNKELQEMLKIMAGYVRPPKELHKWQDDLASRIDLMACCVADSEEGLNLIHYLEKLTGVNWAASKTKIGSGDDVPDKFNWVMETEEDMGSVHVCYFHEDKLRNWKYSAGFWSDVGGYVQTAGKVAGAVSTAASAAAGCNVQ